MKSFITAAFLLLWIFSAGQAVSAQTKTPVLVELFTSEGCPTCPPADKNLIYLENEQPIAGVEIIALALHVDYWDRSGWKDEFASPLFSRRQELYSRQFELGGTFTPQMVVDGRLQLIGSRLDEAKKAIANAAKINKSKIELLMENDQLKINITNLPKHEAATVFLAVTESNLKNNVSRGENRGKTLLHASIVRELRSLGMIPAEIMQFSVKDFLQFQPVWKKENLKFVVFVQENASRKVLAVAQIAASL